MKTPHHRCSLPLLSGLVLGLSGLMAHSAVIDLSKPLSDSLTPSGLYWKFDEGTVDASTPAATDHSGNGYSGTLTPSATGGLPTYAPGRFGNGVNIRRTSGSTPGNLDPNVYWEATASGGSAAGLDFAEAGAFTAGLWLKMDDIDTGSNQLIYLIERGPSVFYSTNPATRQRNFFSFQLNKWADDSWTINLMLGDGTNPTVTANGGVSFRNLNDLDWHHLAFSLEETEGGSLVRFFIDGEQLGQSVVSYTLAALIAANGSERQVRVGERNASAYGSTFNGTVDDVFITSGAHTFMIPEPGSVALLSLTGLGAAALARKKLLVRK